MKKTKVETVLKDILENKRNEEKTVVDIYLENKDKFDNMKSQYRKEYEKDPTIDLAYNAEMLSFRHPGMGNAIHLIKGDNSMSIITLQISAIQNCILQGVYTLEEFEKVMAQMKVFIKKDVKTENIDKEG